MSANEEIWDIQRLTTDIQKKIALLMVGSSPGQYGVLCEAQEGMMDWEKNSLDRIRKEFEE